MCPMFAQSPLNECWDWFGQSVRTCSGVTEWPQCLSHGHWWWWSLLLTRDVTLTWCWLNAGSPSATIAQHLTNVIMLNVPSKRDTWKQCCFNVGPASQTVTQRESDIGLMYRVSGYRLQRWTSFNIFSAGTDFIRQILTSKVDPRTDSAKYL